MLRDDDLLFWSSVSLSQPMRKCRDSYSGFPQPLLMLNCHAAKLPARYASNRIHKAQIMRTCVISFLFPLGGGSFEKDSHPGQTLIVPTTGFFGFRPLAFGRRRCLRPPDNYLPPLNIPSTWCSPDLAFVKTMGAYGSLPKSLSNCRICRRWEDRA